MRKAPKNKRKPASSRVDIERLAAEVHARAVHQSTAAAAACQAVGGASGSRRASSSSAAHVLPASFSMLYESGDGRLCVFESAEGHVCAVDATRLA